MKNKSIKKHLKYIIGKFDWREIVGYYRPYYTDIDGNIYSITANGKLKQLKPWLSPPTEDGYCYVKLKCSDGKYKSRRVNRLVATAYHNNLDNLPVADHINGKRQDNRPVNIRWASYRDNATNRRKRGDTH